MSKTDISLKDFEVWKADPVTKLVLDYLNNIASYYLDCMTSDELLSDPKGQLRMNRLKGYTDAVYDLLALRAESLFEATIEEDNNEDGESTRI